MLKFEYINYLVCNLAVFCKYQSFRPEEQFLLLVKFAVGRGEGRGCGSLHDRGKV
jgi:hypothetical protein